MPPPTTWKTAALEFEGVEHDGATFVVHVFLNQPDANADTPRSPADGYAGYMTVFAHGDCWGDIGHCDIPEHVAPFDLRPAHPLTAFNASLDISDPLRALPNPTGSITVTTLAFNKQDDDADVLRFDHLTLLTYA